MIDLTNYNILQIYLLFITNILQGVFNKDLFLGIMYITIHCIYALLIVYSAFINVNIIHLFMIVIIIIINVISILFLRTCPLFLLEKKYLNTSALNSFLKIFKQKVGFTKRKKHLSKYLSFHLDELTLEYLLVISLIYIIKILFLMVY